jgi:hypothetical protein
MRKWTKDCNIQHLTTVMQRRFDEGDPTMVAEEVKRSTPAKAGRYGPSAAAALVRRRRQPRG